MKLHDRIKWFVSSKAFLDIIAPAENTFLKIGDDFYCEAVTNKNGAVNVYLNGIFLKTITADHGVASDMVSIPESAFGYGTAFVFSENEQAPAGTVIPRTLTLQLAALTASQQVVVNPSDYPMGDCDDIADRLENENVFIFGTEATTVDTIGNEHVQSFGSVTIEVDVSDEPFTD